MTIRHSTYSDLPAMQEIFAQAKARMAAMGNTLQWVNGYPDEARLINDIDLGVSYIVEDAGEVVGTFVLIVGEDPTYRIIYQGQWLDDTLPYGTIHRVASCDGVHSLMTTVLAYAFDQINNIRIDTHRDNAPMRHVVEKAGFHYCGIIHTHNGDDRLVYQKIQQPSIKAVN